MNNNGHNMLQKKGVKSTEECCSACTNTAGCVGFTFVHSRGLSKGQCWLKDSIDDLVNDPAVDSGAVDTLPAVPQQSPVGFTYFNWRDCGSGHHADVVSFSPKRMLVGGKNTLKTSANFAQPIDRLNFTLKMTSGALGLTFFDFSGDACQASEMQKSFENQLHLTYKGMNCPVTSGKHNVNLELYIDPLIPKTSAHSTTTLLLHNLEGEEIMCIEVAVEGKSQGEHTSTQLV